MTTTSQPSPVVLVAGHWLGAWAWDQVVAHLDDGDRAVVALTLPGLSADDPERTTRTLDDQAAAIVHAINGSEIGGRAVVLVAHSGANAPVSIVLDRHPELVRRVVWVDSGPVADGAVFAPDLPKAVTELPLPPFDILGQQASLAGLSDADLDRFRTRAVPEPAAVVRQPVELTDPARHGVPTTLVCCSLPGAQMLELARAGHPMFAPVTALEDLEVVDLPTGHWPMWSRPRDLARVIDAAARRVS